MTKAKKPESKQTKLNVSPTKVPKPSYNVPRYSRSRIATESGRYKLVNPKLARAQAKRKTTILAKQGLGHYSASTGEGIALKAGIEGMARRTNLDEETFNRVMQMDPQKLSALYQSSAGGVVFEVFFSYAGIETDPETGAYISDESKLDDFQFLIEQYNKLFPESAV